MYYKLQPLTKSNKSAPEALLSPQTPEQTPGPWSALPNPSQFSPIQILVYITQLMDSPEAGLHGPDQSTEIVCSENQLDYSDIMSAPNSAKCIIRPQNHFPKPSLDERLGIVEATTDLARGASKNILDSIPNAESDHRIYIVDQEGNSKGATSGSSGNQNNRAVQAKKVRYKQSIVYCALCERDIFQSEMLCFTTCEHLFCAKCVEAYVRQRIATSEQIRCPYKLCRAFCRPASLGFLSEKEIRRIEEIQQRFGKLSLMRQRSAIQEPTPGEQIQTQFEQDIEIEDTEDVERSTRKTQQNEIAQASAQLQAKRIDVAQSPLQLIPVNSVFRERSLPSTRKPTLKSMLNSAAIFRQQSPARKDPNIGNQNSQGFIEYFPVKMFEKLCSGVWSNKWSKFLLMLPLSILILVAFLVSTAVWLAVALAYFLVTWCLLVPAIWSVVEIYRCFQRSIQNHPRIRNAVFLFSLLCFPLLIVFFYLLTLGIILYSGYYKPDMSHVLSGRVPALLRGQKTYLKERKTNNRKCGCSASQDCLECRVKADNLICGCLML